MRYAASQPYLFPPLYIVDRMSQVQRWIVMEEAQFDRRHVTIKLRNKAGPLQAGPSFASPNRKRFVDVQMTQPDFVGKLARTVQMAYGKQEHYRELKPWFEGLLAKLEGHDILGLCWESCAEIIALLDLDVTMLSSLSLIMQRPKDPSQWIADLGKAAGCDAYICGMVGINAYVDQEPFDAAGITITAQHFNTEMDAASSILDALFLHGKEAVRKELQGGTHDIINR